jgi:hypothetical protein
MGTQRLARRYARHATAAEEPRAPARTTLLTESKPYPPMAALWIVAKVPPAAIGPDEPMNLEARLALNVVSYLKGSWTEADYAEKRHVHERGPESSNPRMRKIGVVATCGNAKRMLFETCIAVWNGCAFIHARTALAVILRPGGCLCKG